MATEESIKFQPVALTRLTYCVDAPREEAEKDNTAGHTATHRKHNINTYVTAKHLKGTCHMTTHPDNVENNGE